MGKPFFLHKSFWKMVFKGIDYDRDKDDTDDSVSDYKELLKEIRKMNWKEWSFFFILLVPFLTSLSCAAIFSFLSYKGTSLVRTFYMILGLFSLLVPTMSYTRFLRKHGKNIDRIYRNLRRKSRKSKRL